MEPGKQFEQLPMFMSAREIKDNYEPNDRRPGEVSPSRVWNRKLRESKKVGEGQGIAVRRNPGGDFDVVSLHDHIAEHGVSQAVYLGTSEKKVYDGHHRVASASVSRPDSLVPVIHATSAGDAFEDRALQKHGKRRRRVA